MRNLFFLYLLGFLAQSKIRFLLSLLSISLGIALFTATQINGFRAEASLLDQSLGFSADSYAGVLTGNITKGDPNAFVLRQIWEKAPASLELDPLFKTEGSLTKTDGFVSFPVLGRDISKNLFSGTFLKPESQKDSKRSTFPRFFISTALQEKLDFRKNSSISLRICSHDIALQGEETIPLSQNGLFVVMDIVDLQELCEEPEMISQILIKGEEQIANSFFEKHAFEGFSYESITTISERANSALASLRINLTIVSLISVLISLFMVSNSLTGVFLSRRKEMGILLSLGVSRLQNFLLFLSQALLLGISGSILGALLGIFFSELSFFTGNTTLTDSGQVSAYGKVPVTIVFQSIGVGVLGSLVACLIPGRKAFLLEPIDLVKSDSILSDSSKKSVSLWLFLLGLLMVLVGESLSFYPSPKSLLPGLTGVGILIVGIILFVPAILQISVPFLLSLSREKKPPSVLLALQEIQYESWTNSLTVGTILLSVSLVLVLSCLTDSYRKTIVAWVEEDNPFHGSIIHRKSLEEGKPGVEIGIEEQILKLGILEKVEPFVIQPKVPIGNSLFTLHAYPFPKIWDPDRIIVSTNFCYLEKICKGQNLELPTQTQGKISFKVQGVKDHFFSERGTIVMDLQTYRKYFPVEKWNSIRFSFLPGINVVEGIQRVQEELHQIDPELQVLDQEDLKALYLQGLEQVFAILGSLKSTAMVLSFMTLFSALLYNIKEKSKLLAGLRAIGMSSSQLFGFVFIQALFLYGMGTLLGLVSAFLIAPSVLYGINLNAFGWKLQAAFPWKLLPYLFLSIPPVALLLSWFPFVSESRKSLRSALSYE